MKKCSKCRKKILNIGGTVATDYKTNKQICDDCHSKPY